MSQVYPGSPGHLIPQPRRRGGFLRVLGFIGLGLLGFVALVAGCTVQLTQEVTAAGNKFLADMTGPDPATAWRAAGPDLQRTIDEAGFRRWVDNHNLQGGTVGFWNNRSRNDSAGALQGTMTLRDNGTVPLRLVLRRNAAGVWQVIGVSVDGGDRVEGGTKT